LQGSLPEIERSIAAQHDKCKELYGLVNGGECGLFSIEGFRYYTTVTAVS
jgi:hypothetical protein